MIVEPFEIPDLPSEPHHGEDPRVWHDAASHYLLRALDGHATERDATRAAHCLVRAAEHPLVARWPLARSIVRHDLGLAHLLAAEVAAGDRERRLLLRAVDHLEAASTEGPMGWSPRYRAILLHNLGYAYERLAAIEADARAARAAAWALGESRAILALAGERGEA